MILLSVIVAALGLTAIVLTCLVMWPEKPRPLDELEARRRLRPDTGNVDRVDQEAS